VVIVVVHLLSAAPPATVGAATGTLRLIVNLQPAALNSKLVA
jgi:hypothetical protein